MSIYLDTVEGFGILFDALQEDISMRYYFINECGWTESQFKKIEDYSWFCAKVSAWKNEIELGTSYLGACCYKTVEEFYTKYKDDYLAVMIKEAIAEAKNQASKPRA